MARKYNPDVHSAVVGNLKRGFKERFNRDLLLSDETIWNMYEEWGLVTDDEHPNDPDFCTYEALNESNKP